MGLNNGPLDTLVRNEGNMDVSEDEDEYLEIDEDYYTSKYVKVLDQKLNSPIDKTTVRTSSAPAHVPRACAKKAINGNKYHKTKREISQTTLFPKGACSGVGDSTLLKLGAKSFLSIARPIKIKQKLLQLNRVRRILSDPPENPGEDNCSFQKRKHECDENFQPRNNINRRHSTDKFSPRLPNPNEQRSAPPNKCSNIGLFLKNIGIKRESRLKDMVWNSKNNNVVHSVSPFVQSLDSSVFKSSSASSSASSGGASASVPLLPRACRPSATIGSYTAEKSGPTNKTESLPDKTVTHAIFHALFGQASSLSSADPPEDFTSSGVSNVSGEGDLPTSTAPHPELMCPEDKRMPAVDEQWLSGTLRGRSNSHSSRDSWPIDTHAPRRTASSRSSSDEGPSLGRLRSSSLGQMGHPRSRSNSVTLTSPLLLRSGVFTEVAPLLSSAAFEYALAAVAGGTQCCLSTSSATAPSVKKEEERQRLHVEVPVRDVQSPREKIHPTFPHSPQSSLLTQYITPELITELVLQLSQDNDRLISPRLSVLKAIYKNCFAMRNTVTQALELASYNRVLRCKEYTHMAKMQGIHYDDASAAVLRQDFSREKAVTEDMGFFPSTMTGGKSTAMGDCKQGMGGGGVPSPAAGGCSPAGGGGRGRGGGDMGASVRDHDGSIIDLLLFVTEAEFALVCGSSCGWEASNLDEIFNSISIVMSNTLRCYGSHLTSAAGAVDNCPVLKGIIKIVQMCLTVRDGAMKELEKVQKWTDGLLEKLLKHWPRADTMRELAYWRVSAAVLLSNSQFSHSTCSSTPRPSVPSSQASSPAPSPSPAPAPASLSSSSSLLTRRSTCPPSQRLIKKLMSAITSTHYKISIEAIRVSMQPGLFIPVLGGGTGSTGWESAEGSPLVAELMAALRSNRQQHWHAVVRTTSELALDALRKHL